LFLAGAIGVVGFAVVYFLDPQEGPRRRRRTLDALQDAAYEALRLSQQLVDRLAEPAAVEPVRQAPEPRPRRGEDADLAKTLQDEVAIFRVEPDTEEAAVPVGVGGPAEDRLEAELPPRGGSDRVSYVHSVTAPPTPRPTIISYDREPEEERVVRDMDASTTRPRTGWRRGALVGAVTAVVLLGAAALGAWAVWGGDEGTKSAAPLSPGAVQALQLISQPGARSVSVAGSKEKMVLVVTPSGRAALIISGLTEAPKGKEYQAWIIVGKQPPMSAGLFKGGNTRLVIPLAQKLPKGAIFAVTVERAGGVPAPTGKPKFSAKIY
jgi:anti-sigma-K factor RskA